MICIINGGKKEMVTKNIMLSLCIVLFAVVITVAADEPIVECNMSRVIYPKAYHGNNVACAASFVHGAYVENSKDQDDFLHSDTLIPKFEAIPEDERWGYPEYVVIKYMQAWKAGNLEEAISFYEEGESRDKKRKLQTQSIETIQNFMKPLTRVVFIDKSYYGPYVRISWVMSGVSSSGSTKNQKGVPGYNYLKLVDGRYMLTMDVDMTHLFDSVAGTYSRWKYRQRKSIHLNPNVTDMDWFAIDSDSNIVLSKDMANVPGSFPVNHLKVYVKGEPLNVQLKSDKQVSGLSDQMRFFESAVTKHQVGTESEVLSLWSGGRKENIKKNIDRLKASGDWPKFRTSPFGEAPTVLFSMPTSLGTVVYYKKKAFLPPNATAIMIEQANNRPVHHIGLEAIDGKYTFFNESSKSELNIFTNKMFIDAANALYAPK